MAKFLSSLAGFGVTFGSMFKRPVTESYPENPGPVKPRYHGRHQLNRYADGLEKCIGCELCAWACPADAIYVEGADNTDEQRFSPGERYGRVYQINYLRCIGCGLCVEACPTRCADDDQPLRDGRRQSGRPDPRKAPATGTDAGGHDPGAAPQGRRIHRRRLLPRQHHRRRPAQLPISDVTK